MGRSERAVKAAVRVVAPLGLLALVAVPTGCSSKAPDPEPAVTPFAELIEQTIEEASSSGAGEDQRAILEQAKADGVLSFDQAREATWAAIDCMTAAGLEATYDESNSRGGVVIPGYLVQVGLDDDGTNEGLVGACETKESFWVSQLFQTQPASIEAQDAYVEKQAPVLRACLEEAGYATDPEATGADLVDQAVDVLLHDDPDVDCLTEAGL